MAEFNKYATGAAIKKLRCEKKISQEVLSGLAGIARSHLAMIESGKKQTDLVREIESRYNEKMSSTELSAIMSGAQQGAKAERVRIEVEQIINYWKGDL